MVKQNAGQYRTLMDNLCQNRTIFEIPNSSTDKIVHKKAKFENIKRYQTVLENL